MSQPDAAAVPANGASASAGDGDLSARLRDLGLGGLQTTDDIRKPDIDDRQYRLLRLPNEIEILLVHDPDTEKAAAAMDVNVGHLSDPEDWQGLAHFLEHLLFMGTEKYPQENDYSEFLAKHSGYSNAFTGAEDTNYYFEVSSDHLEPALDRFAQFFIAPLFNESGVDREMQAVDSEHKKNLQSDPWRLHQLDCTLSDSKHPWSRFGTGCLETLRQEGKDIRRVLMDFHERYYSANLMKCVVLGKESLDQLAAMVVPLFAPVVNKKLPIPAFPTNPLTSEFLLKRIHAKPIKDLRTLELTFSFPDTMMYYHTQPSRYLSHLIGHEADGSLLAYLKDKGWATGLSAGLSRGAIGFDFFKIHVELTLEGLEQWENVILACFSYIKMIKSAGVQKWIWEETARLQDISFRFREKRQPSTFVSRIAGQMQLYHGRELLSGPYLMEKYDEAAIQLCLDGLGEGNWRVTLVTQRDLGLEGPKHTEKWYGTEYTSDDISWLKERVAGLKPDPAFHLPAKNDFIPENLDLINLAAPGNPREPPKLLLNEPRVMLWHKTDNVFKVPKANVFLMFKTPVAYLDPFASVAARMLTELFRDFLVEYTYFAEVAGLHYSLEAHVDGVLLAVQGYNDKIPVFLERILTKIRENGFVSDQRFPLIREQLARTYANWKLESPHSHALYNTTSLLQDVIWTHAEKIAIIEDPDFTPDVVRRFVPQLFDRCSVEMLVHGNVSREQALSMWRTVEGVVKMKPLAEAERKKSSRSMLLPESSSWIWEREVPNPENVNSAIEYYLECGDPMDVGLRCRVQLLTQIAYEPCFDQLRTKEQLGYLVWSGNRRLAGTLGFRIVVQSEKDPAYLESRIESFLVQLRTMIAEMSPEDYQKHVNARILSILEKDKTLSAETSRWWSHIEGQGRSYEFDQEQTDAEYLRNLPKAELLEFYDTWIQPSSSQRRKFSMHMRSPLAKVDDSVKLDERNKRVEDALEFKTSLRISRGAVPVKKMEDYMA